MEWAKGGKKQYIQEIYGQNFILLRRWTFYCSKRIKKDLVSVYHDLRSRGSKEWRESSGNEGCFMTWKKLEKTHKSFR